MNEEKIIASLTFHGGTQGFEQNYNCETSLEEYKRLFTAKSEGLNGKKSVLTKMWLTEHNQNGDWVYDEKGTRKRKLIYDRSKDKKI